MSTTETPIDELRELIRNLFDRDATAERAKLMDDPESYFASKGLTEVRADDVDRCVAEIAPGYAGSGHYANVTQGSHAAAAAGSPAAQAAAQQVVAHYETVVQQYGDITYVDQSSETYVDNSVNIDDLSAEGDIELDFDVHNETTVDNDNVSADDGGVAVGEGSSIDGNINTGEVNGVQGDGNTVDDLVFGDGNAVTEDNDVTTVDTDGGDATVLEGDGNTITNVDVAGSEDTNVVLGDHNTQSADDIDQSVNDSYDTDNSVDNSINDSYDTEDSYNTDIDDHSTTIDDHSVDVQTDVTTDVGLL